MIEEYIKHQIINTYKILVLREGEERGRSKAKVYLGRGMLFFSLFSTLLRKISYLYYKKEKLLLLYNAYILLVIEEYINTQIINTYKNTLEEAYCAFSSFCVRTQETRDHPKRPKFGLLFERFGNINSKS